MVQVVQRDWVLPANKEDADELNDLIKLVHFERSASPNNQPENIENEIIDIHPQQLRTSIYNSQHGNRTLEELVGSLSNINIRIVGT